MSNSLLITSKSTLSSIIFPLLTIEIEIKLYKLPLYTFDAVQPKKIGTASIKLTTIPNSAVAFLSDEAIQPLFKQGSIFIVDTKLKPKKDSLVAVKLEKNPKILIRKFHIERNKKWIKSIDDSIDPVILDQTYHSIIGVIIQINAKN